MWQRAQAQANLDRARRRLEHVERALASAQEPRPLPAHERRERKRWKRELVERTETMILAVLRETPIAGLRSKQIAATLAARGLELTPMTVGMHLSWMRRRRLVVKVGHLWLVAHGAENKEPADAEALAGPELRSAPEGADQPAVSSSSPPQPKGGEPDD